MIFIILRISGLPLLIRELIQRNKITILLFHDINEKSAEKSVLYLSKKYNIIDLNEFIDSIESKDLSRIPKKPLILTFDDGHIGNYKILPIIKKYNLPVTIFLCTSLINTRRHFWFKLKDRTIPVEKLKKVTNSERKKILFEYGFNEDMEFDTPQALQKTQIDEMKDYVNFGSHTMSHPILPQCTHMEAKKEILESKALLENEYKISVKSIAYPNGDYSERDIFLAKEAGYRCGLTCDFGFNTIKTDIFRLKRISVNDTNDINELCVRASGLWAFIRTRNGSRKDFGYQKSIE